MRYQIVPSFNALCRVTTFHVMRDDRLTPVAITETREDAAVYVFTELFRERTGP